jgi:hydroxycarboxylate dehydrogenase B
MSVVARRIWSDSSPDVASELESYTIDFDWLRQAKAIPGQAIMTPGEPERAARAKRTATGVPLPSEAWASIVAAARSVGVNRDLSF